MHILAEIYADLSFSVCNTFNFMILLNLHEIKWIYLLI